MGVGAPWENPGSATVNYLTILSFFGRIIFVYFNVLKRTWWQRNLHSKSIDYSPFLTWRSLYRTQQSYHIWACFETQRRIQGANLLFGLNFSITALEMKNWTEGGGGVSNILLCRSASDQSAFSGDGAAVVSWRSMARTAAPKSSRHCCLLCWHISAIASHSSH